MQAVVKIGSSQYLVQPGQELLIDHQEKTKGNSLFDQVLLVVDEGKIQVGQPYVPGFKITAQVLGESKGKKIRVATYKAKSRYRKVKGFRPQYTRIKIEKISRETKS